MMPMMGPIPAERFSLRPRLHLGCLFRLVFGQESSSVSSVVGHPVRLPKTTHDDAECWARLSEDHRRQLAALLARLCSLPPLKQYFLNNFDRTSDINGKTSPLKGKLAMEFAAFLRHFYEAQTRSVLNPQNLRALLIKHAPQFQGKLFFIVFNVRLVGTPSF